MKNKGIAVFIVVTFFFILCLMSTPAFAIPQLINYNGVLTDKATGDPITTPGLTMKFRIYDAETDGTMLWEEARTVPVENGIYNVILGAVTPVTTDLFSSDEQWLEVEVASEVLTPRQRLTSVAYAMKAQDALTLAGRSATEYASKVELSTSGSGVAVHWNNLSNVPAGFADGIDNDSGGDITAVNAGAGLGGGGTSGDVTLRIKVPLSLVSSNTNPIITAENSGSGTGLSGKSANGYGVYGLSTNSYAGYFDGDVKVAGTGKGVEFPDGTKQTTAPTATGDITGVTAGTGLSGGGTAGNVTLNVNVPLSLISSNTNPIITAENTGSGAGIYGKSTSGYGVSGKSTNSFAGYFSGDVKVAGTNKGIEFPDGTKQTTALVGGGVPSGFLIMGSTPTPPAGYTYTGMTVSLDGTNIWTAKANLPITRSRLAAATVNNKIYAIGGYAGASPLNWNEEYDPATNAWATKTDMPTARKDLAAAVVNNKIYVTGGRNGPNLNKNEEYDPATNAWTTRADMPSARFGLAAAAVNNKIYAIGGAPNYAKNEEYDPATNTWTTRAEMPTERYQLTAAVVNNKIYVIGGWDSIAYLCKNEEYDPATNTWATREDMPTTRRELSAAVVNNKIYVIGGYNGNLGGSLRTNEEYTPSILYYVQQKD